MMQRIAGFSLVELMISITLATAMSLGVVGIYVSQSGIISQEKQRVMAFQDANRRFDILSRL